MTRQVLAFFLATAVSLIIGPKIIDLLTRLKLRQTVSEDAPKRHQGKQGTPMMGGLIILAGTLVATIAFWDANPRLTAVVLLTLSFAALGFLDDMLIAMRGKALGLKARQKLLVQFILAIAFMVWVHGNRMDPGNVLLWGGRSIDLGCFYYPIMVFMIVGMSNAFNLTDGLDGLLSGMTAILALTLGVILLGRTEAELRIVSWALAGGCVGFLWYNCNPAKVFMGDTGSLALGAATAGIAIAEGIEFLYLLVGLIFIVEALSDIVQVISFKTTGKRVLKMAPIHHHFELIGWPEQKIVVRFWIVQGLISLAVLGLAGIYRIWD